MGFSQLRHGRGINLEKKTGLTFDFHIWVSLKVVVCSLRVDFVVSDNGDLGSLQQYKLQVFISYKGKMSQQAFTG